MKAKNANRRKLHLKLVSVTMPQRNNATAKSFAYVHNKVNLYGSSASPLRSNTENHQKKLVMSALKPTAHSNAFRVIIIPAVYYLTLSSFTLQVGMYIHPNLGHRYSLSQASSSIASSYSIPSLLESTSFDSVHTSNPIAVREAFESFGADFSRRSSNSAITAGSITSPLFLGLHRVLHSSAPNPIRAASLGMTTVTSTIARNNAHSNTMRTFGAIICRDCLYLEFPGCDIHGMLYCERVILEVDDSTENRFRDQIPDNSNFASERHSNQQHAKCAKCAAATNNVRPFRDGCRRCKGSTSVHMWNTSQKELAKAFEAFPSQLEEIHHTVLVCEFCQSVIFPRALDQLTQRTDRHVLTILNSGKPLQISNYQLNMPHVDGCPRKGMPLQGTAIHLPKGELKFAYDRIQDCPIPDSIRTEIQYQKRDIEVVATQNHLQQVCYLHSNQIRLTHTL